MAFFVKYSRRLQRCFPAETSTVRLDMLPSGLLDLRLLLYQVTLHLLLMDGQDYTFWQLEKQGTYFYPLSFTPASLTRSYPIPASRARKTAWARSATCNLLNIFET